MKFVQPPPQVFLRWRLMFRAQATGLSLLWGRRRDRTAPSMHEVRCIPPSVLPGFCYAPNDADLSIRAVPVSGDNKRSLVFWRRGSCAA